MATATSSPSEAGHPAPRAEPESAWRRFLAAPRSLKYRCLRSIALVSGLTWLVVTLTIVALARHESDAMFDASLRELAHMALAFADHELAEIQRTGGGDVSDDTDEVFSDKIVYQVWQQGGVLGYRSANAPAQTPLAPGAAGFGDTVLDGQPLRTYNTWNRDRSFQIQMAASPERHQHYGLWVSLALCIGMLSALCVFLLLIRRQLDQAFAPLNDTAEALAGKSAADLSPVELDGQPAELAPVIGAFNGLMRRMSQTLRYEQRFTSDAAHELRTPLSGLKILVRNAQRARSAEERREALQQMDVAIDRSTTLIGQLLALARYDRDPSQFALHETVDLWELATSVWAGVAPLAEEKGIRLHWSPGRPLVSVRGNHDALAVVLRNLIENALVHTPPGGEVLIEAVAEAGDGQAQWLVHDSGPGVPPKMRERVFARFVRVDRSSAPGAGLGLAIVKRIVEIHGGSVVIGESPRLGGALVTLRLPLA
ncbi:MAG: sensor histidine kinase N-terminal domain-containing protein [Rhizobacter sp.]|nr:sensor histidine kinase N-terminal domain-containing protein [Rhizobacter sp.]